MSLKAAILLLVLIPSLCACRKVKEKTDRTDQRYPKNPTVPYNAGMQLEVSQAEEDRIYSRMPPRQLLRPDSRRKRSAFEKINRFTCENDEDEHIHLSRKDVCNGLYNCKDGSDEKNCQNHTCPIFHFPCDDGGCLQIEFQCDGGKTDCSDKSDETECQNTTCPDGFFRCNSGQCVLFHYRCNRLYECTDQSDESNCDNMICPEDYYTCQDEGSQRCMSQMYICDYAYWWADQYGFVSFSFCSHEFDLVTCDNYTCADPQNYFQCNSGFCITNDLVCNMRSDCPDGVEEDEVSCESHKCTDKYELMFQCRSGHCIQSTERCNNRIDCPDGSDENNCYNFTCPNLFYQCASGNCYPVEEQCDNYSYCLLKTDELNCHKAICPDEYFRCNSGQCVFYPFRCDGVVDCLDASDESGCDNICPEHYYKCPDGRCITNVMIICEHSYLSRHFPYLGNCFYDVDSNSCANYTCINKKDFQCNSGHCVPWYERCNTSPICPDRSDEKGCFSCNSLQYRCRWARKCVGFDLRCNGENDCPYDVDEKNCDTTTCPSGFFRCESAQCVMYTYRCDGAPHCSDASDETDCDAMQCPLNFHKCLSGGCMNRLFICEYNYVTSDVPSSCSYELDNAACDNYTCSNENDFQCDNGGCLPANFRCNYIVDCVDRSDETDCKQCNPTTEYQCYTGECIFQVSKCDGKMDCLDGSDEMWCESLCDLNEFKCWGDRCIPMKYRCDGKTDCPDGSDEDFCEPTCDLDEFKCNSGECIPRQYQCDPTEDCPDESDEVYYLCPDVIYGCGMWKTFQCSKTLKCIGLEYRCDGKIDCSNTFLDALSDDSDEVGCVSYEGKKCSSFEYQCQSGKCISLITGLCNGYFESNLCTVTHDDEMYCPYIKCNSDFLRLETGGCIPPVKWNASCSTDEVANSCPYPCPTSTYIRCCNCHCIHRVSICDGIIDCPDKADERHCGKPECRADQFECGNINCLPLELMYDGFEHCPDGHDEPKTRTAIFTKSKPAVPLKDFKPHCFDPSICLNPSQICSLTGHCQIENHQNSCFVICKEPCACSQVGIMDCQQWEKHTSSSMPLNNFTNILWPFDVTNILYRYEFKNFFTFEIISKLSITNASLTQMPSRILSCAFNIHYLNLSHNKITRVHVGDFGGLYRLSVLDLSNNLISFIEDFSFKGMRVFQLALERNLITQFGVDLFSGMAVDGSITTDEYRLCCVRPANVPEQNCYPKADQFSSCTDLIKNDVLRIFLWLFGFISLIGNGCVLFHKIVLDSESLQKNYGIMVINLALADVLMGVYLLSIASVDALYRGYYVTVDAEWRNSSWCSLAGVLCTVSSEVSVLFICLITIERYIVTKYPFKQVRLSHSTLRGISIGIWLSSIAIAVTPLIISPYFKGKFYSKTGVCIALPLTTESFEGWEYSFAISVCLNFCLLLVVGVGQSLIYKEIAATRRRIVSTRRDDDSKISRRLMLVVLSDFCCWIPIGVCGMLALAGIEIPADVYAWLTVFVLPINSALNPFLYTGMSEWFKC